MGGEDVARGRIDEDPTRRRKVLGRLWGGRGRGRRERERGDRRAESYESESGFWRFRTWPALSVSASRSGLSR